MVRVFQRTCAFSVALGLCFSVCLFVVLFVHTDSGLVSPQWTLCAAAAATPCGYLLNAYLSQPSREHRACKTSYSSLLHIPSTRAAKIAPEKPLILLRYVSPTGAEIELHKAHSHFLKGTSFLDPAFYAGLVPSLFVS